MSKLNLTRFALHMRGVHLTAKINMSAVGDNANYNTLICILWLIHMLTQLKTITLTVYTRLVLRTINIMMQHWRNDNGETRVNCNFEVRITDKCDNLGLGAWVAVPVPVMASCLCTVTVTTQCQWYSIWNANTVLRSRMLMNGPQHSCRWVHFICGTYWHDVVRRY